MRILIIMDPIDRSDPKADTSVGFILAAQARGHVVEYCQQEDLFVKDGQGAAQAQRVTVDVTATPFYELGARRSVTLSEYDTVWMRKDPPVDRAYLHATHILDLAGDTLVVNSPRGIRYANEKMCAQLFPALCPETLVTRDMGQIKAWLSERNEPLVVKPIDGHGGAGVFVIQPGDRNLGSILETLSEEGERWVVAQAYLPAARQGDKRIILIDGEPLGAILRVPRDDDHRGNIHVGGTVEFVELDARDRAICATVGPVLQREGLWFVGLDVIGGYLTEVNVTSPTGIREIKALGDIDLGDAFVAWVEARLKSAES